MLSSSISFPLQEIFIKKLMQDGKRQTSERIVKALILHFGSWEHLELVIKKVSPQIITRSMKRGATRYQVPILLHSQKQYQLGIQWIIQSARSKKGKAIVFSLIQELKDIQKEQGLTWNKKMQVHKNALANRAWLHYRW